MKADVCLLSNRIEEGLRAVEEGLEVVTRTGERYYEAELRRLRADLQASRQGFSREPIERELITSIEVARSQSARLFELRAAMSLGGIWCAEGRTAEAIVMITRASHGIVDQLPDLDQMELRVLLMRYGDTSDRLCEESGTSQFQS
jgi:predicted ATPase